VPAISSFFQFCTVVRLWSVFWDTSGLRCDAAPGVASVVESRRVPSASGSSADVVLGSNFGRTTFRELRGGLTDTLPLQLPNFPIGESNVNKPAP
jgi:hypothetical protein